MIRIKLSMMMLLLSLWTASVWAIDPLAFKDRAEEVRFQKLAAELRCMQCQNQSLADSDATLAQDMRKLVLEQIQAGKSDQEIKTFFVQRYGNFATYMPPVNNQTIWLWLLPGLTALGGAVWLVRTHRAKSKPASGTDTKSDVSTDTQNW